MGDRVAVEVEVEVVGDVGCRYPRAHESMRAMVRYGAWSTLVFCSGQIEASTLAVSRYSGESPCDVLVHAGPGCFSC